MHATSMPTFQDHLAEPLRAGAPDVLGPLAVFPVFGPPATVEYRAFSQAVGHGVAIKELEDGASVNDLVVVNGSDTAVLLFEGEEVLGAQQNRTFDVSVLVPAGAALRVPVCCVEAGRWDGARHGEAFSPAPQAAYPALRKLKNRASADALAAGHAPRAAQGAVWNEVAAKAGRLKTHSRTSAMHDIYEDRRDRLAEFKAAIPLHEGQTGALVAVGGAMTVLDHVSRPEVFAALHEPLVHGYALDALESGSRAAPSTEDAQAFLGRLMTARVTHHDGLGLGHDVRVAEPGLMGAGLVAGEELVQLTAFGDDDASTPGRARIRRPSRRR